MNHIDTKRLVVLKRPGFQSQQYGMAIVTSLQNIPLHFWLFYQLYAVAWLTQYTQRYSC